MEASIAARYVLLGLRLGKHVDGLVDGYFGPPELKATVDSEEPAPPPELVDEAAALLDELDAADSSAYDAQRRRWLQGQLLGLACLAEVIAGAEIAWPDKVRRCFGIDVAPVPEERFAEAHERLDEELPGDGAVGARLEEWRRSQEMPREKVLPAFEALVRELRERTCEVVDLPEGERMDPEIVGDRPWSAYNWYLGRGKSRI